MLDRPAFRVFENLRQATRLALRMRQSLIVRQHGFRWDAGLAKRRQPFGAAARCQNILQNRDQHCVIRHTIRIGLKARIACQSRPTDNAT